MADIILGIIILAAVAAVMRKKINDKKNGRSSCGCSCGGCAAKGNCHRKPHKGSEE